MNIIFKVAEKFASILGLRTTGKLGLNARVRTLKESQSTNNIFEGLACNKDYESDIDLMENPNSSWRIRQAIKEEGKQELGRMLK